MRMETLFMAIKSPRLGYTTCSFYSAGAFGDQRRLEFLLKGGIELGVPALVESVPADARRITGGAAKPKTLKQIAKWLKDPYSDAAEYKMWGVPLTALSNYLDILCIHAEQYTIKRL